MAFTFENFKATLVQQCLNNFKKFTFDVDEGSISLHIPRSKDDVQSITSYLSTFILELARKQDPNVLLLPNKLIKWVRDTFLQIGDEGINVTINEDTLREIGVLRPPVQIRPSLIMSFMQERLALYSRRLNTFMHKVNHGHGDNQISESEIPMSQLPVQYIEAVSSFDTENGQYWIYDPICSHSYNARLNLYDYHSKAVNGGFDSTAFISLDRLDEIIERNTWDSSNGDVIAAQSFYNLYPAL